MGWSSCAHEWVVKAKTFAPPRAIDEADWDNVEAIERAGAGVTTVLLVCPYCGATRQHEMLGKEGP